MSWLWRRGLGICFVVWVLHVSGCGPSKLATKDTHPVSGTLMISGKPAPGIGILLQPTDGSGGQPHGSSGANGAFVLRTYSNAGPPDGAPDGEYTVILSPYGEGTGPLPPGVKPAKLPSELENSGKVITISGESEITIEVP